MKKLTFLTLLLGPEAPYTKNGKCWATDREIFPLIRLEKAKLSFAAREACVAEVTGIQRKSLIASL